MSESNPLVERVDALLKRHQQQRNTSAPVEQPVEPPPRVDVPLETTPAVQNVQPEDDIPVLTEIVDAQAGPTAGADLQGLAHAEAIEAAVLEKLLVELDRSLEMRLNRTIGEVVEQAMDGLRADLSGRVRDLVREAVATALAQQISDRTRLP